MCEECEYDQELDVEDAEVSPEQAPLLMTRFVLAVLRDRPTMSIPQIRALAKVVGLEIPAAALLDAEVVHRTARALL